ncbi:MAG: hypothetical protein J0M12_14590 [Deltaproteobacteria bacterium]|nr:hypothetical protein [Deltaproteobacteria bacterium]
MTRTLKLLSLLLCACVWNSSAWAGDGITVGFPEFDKSMNVLASSHPAAQFLRRAVTGRLADAPQGGSFRLLLSDSMTSSSDRLVWSFRISPLATFSDGVPVLASDVEYSLDRCSKLGALNGVRSIDSEVESSAGRSVQWVRIHLDAPSGTLLDEVSRCPVLARRASLIFGKDLGEGTNVVSAGEYAFSDLKMGREIALRRLRSGASQAVAAGPDVLNLRSFKDSSAALAALRAGTIDAFLSQDQAVIERAKKDETLLAQQCPIYTVILRKGLKIACPDQIIASEIRYLS